MLFSVTLFALGLILLIKGGDWFVDGAVGLARRFHLPELLIGATVVSIGTTLPEVMVSAQAALQHNSGISYGNAIGSVICNTSLIAALTIAIRPTDVNRKILRLPAAAFFTVAAVYAVIVYTARSFLRWHGVMLLCLFAAYMILTVKHMRSYPESGQAPEDEAAGKKRSTGIELALLAFGAAAIAAGANLLVNNGTKIASAMGVPDSVIGLTMIALGTSLPELATAISALVKGHSALSLGNIIGANIFNLVLVCGTAITISPFSVPAEKMFFGLNSSLVVDIPVMFAVMLILCLPALRTGKLSRFQGILLLCVYAAFSAFQFIF